MARPGADRDFSQGFGGFLLLGGALVVFAVLWPFAQLLWSDGTRTQVILVGSVLSVLGTLVSAIVGVLLFNRQQSAREDERRAERESEDAHAKQERLRFRVNLAVALRAEIRESASRLTEQFTHDAILDQLSVDRSNLDNALDASGSSTAMPRGIALEPNIIFDNHTDRLYELPDAVIRALVRYYQNDLYLNRYLQRMSDGAFNGIAVQRQKMAVVYYREIGRTTLLAALRAQAVLRAYLIDKGQVDLPTTGDVRSAAARLLSDVDDNKAVATLIRSGDGTRFNNAEEAAEIFEELARIDPQDALADYTRAIGYDVKPLVLGPS
ncbi:hypothetical protein [Tropicimonas sp. S265A]|uniref:hypothetical protein n=1 Tax=Tropicimonas sp. S265A TaxID=3415134 RepID=UPI003C79F26D